MAFKTVSAATVETAYQAARDAYAQIGVDTGKALKALKTTWLFPCTAGKGTMCAGLKRRSKVAAASWQSETTPAWRARATSCAWDMLKAFSLIPGTQRANIHAMYAETDGKNVERDALEPEHFSRWMAWSKEHGIGIDFNGTFFATSKVERRLVALAQ